ncbi:DUF423 domain-containing protein [Roseibium algae]|uniref:DUF423 domain-containing protein n=1 Tax=Roseibium algae TaxID=3123038 RepID=A0ABU8TK34_9HYPH
MSLRSLAAPDAPTSPIMRAALAFGGLTGACGVTLMAMAAHVDTNGLVRTAAEMMLFHAAVLLAIAALAQVRRIPFLVVALALLVVGLGLFCGDLLSRAFLNQRLFTMSAPTGGMMLILGWVALTLSALRIHPR